MADMADMADMQVRHTTRGILNPEAVERKFRLSRPLPSSDVAQFVEHYWIVSWDLRGEDPYTQETLPYPCAHLVFEANRNTRVYGPMTGKFTRQLEQQGQVFGVKFWPAGFYSFLRRPMSQIANRILHFEEVFGERGDDLEMAILARQDERVMVGLAEQFLRARLPEPDERAATLNRIVGHIAAQRQITSVDELLASCAECSMSKRTLQRLFSEYIGVGPKWVIRRFRLHDAAGRIDEGGSVDWPRLAVELGYADQTHFIKDFKAIVGKTPGEYGRKRL